MSYFEDLAVWKTARVQAREIYDAFKDSRDWGFKDQIQRAAVSVMNNIAEGSDAGTPAKYIKYLRDAKGSCAEVRSMLYLAEDVGYLTPEIATKWRDRCYSLSNSIHNLIKYQTEQARRQSQ